MLFSKRKDVEYVLTEERYAAILQLLEQKRAVSILELTDRLQASESTIRRDLAALHKSGKLCKVHGGATALRSAYATREEDLTARQDLHGEEKERIAAAAAALIGGAEFVYLDAGTTTERMIPHLAKNNATYVTNGVHHAAKLAALGHAVFLLGGRVKRSTGALVGAQAVESLRRYNFTKGFFGANGIGIKAGFSTPDAEEGSVKSEAISRCKDAFVLADASKFNRIAPVTFAALPAAAIVTTAAPDRKYFDYTEMIEVDAT